MKKLLTIIGLVSLASVTIVRADISTNTTVLANNINYQASIISATFLAAPVQPQGGRFSQPQSTVPALVRGCPTNKIPAVVLALSNGKITIATDAPPAVKAAQIYGALSYLQTPSKSVPDLEANLYLLQAGVAAIGN